MVLHGIEFAFSVSNPKDLERYEQAKSLVEKQYSYLWESTKEPKTEKEYITLLQAGIDAFAEFFDVLFGEGTANKLFGKQTSFEKVIDLYLEFMEQVKNENKRLQQKIASFVPDVAMP